MIEIIKKAIEFSFKNGILPSSFIFIFVIIQLFLILSLARPAATYIGIITSLIIINLLCIALFSGWLKLAKNIVKPDSDSTDTSSLSVFFEGIGEKFWMNLKITVFYTLLFLVLTIFSYGGIAKVIPSLQLSHADVVAVLQKLETLTPSTANIFDEKLVTFLLLIFILNIAIYAGMYLFSFLLADIYINNEQKFFRNFINTTKFLFKNIFSVTGIFLFTGFLYFGLSLLTFIFQTNVFLSVLGIILSGYYASFYIIVVFLLYEKKKDQSNCDNRCDSDGQN